jgi:Na+-translocating ferredoxin:NAD+ oxidoreductase RnfD subunit
VLYQILSLTGAALILGAYVANQRGLLGPRNATYNLMNLLGALLLLWVAVVDWRWGFILLEAVWALVSIPPLLRRSSAAAG